MSALVIMIPRDLSGPTYRRSPETAHSDEMAALLNMLEFIQQMYQLPHNTSEDTGPREIGKIAWQDITEGRLRWESLEHFTPGGGRGNGFI